MFFFKYTGDMIEDHLSFAILEFRRRLYFGLHTAAQKKCREGWTSPPISSPQETLTMQCHPSPLTPGPTIYSTPKRLFRRYRRQFPFILDDNHTSTFYLLDINRTEIVIFIHFENITTVNHCLKTISY